jgi:hypothetical protein
MSEWASRRYVKCISHINNTPKLGNWECSSVVKHLPSKYKTLGLSLASSKSINKSMKNPQMTLPPRKVHRLMQETLVESGNGKSQHPASAGA